jgi:hypothetical protein
MGGSSFPWPPKMHAEYLGANWIPKILNPVTLARSWTLNSRHYLLVLKYISFIKYLFLSNYISAWYYRGICFYTIITKRGLCSLLTSSQCPNVWITLPMDRAIKCILPHKKEGVWSRSCKLTEISLQKMWFSTGRLCHQDGSWKFLYQPFPNLLTNISAIKVINSHNTFHRRK